MDYKIVKDLPYVYNKQVYMRLSQATTINVCMYLTKEFGFLESFDKRKIGFKCGFVFCCSKTPFFCFVSFSTVSAFNDKTRCGKGVSV